MDDMEYRYLDKIEKPGDLRKLDFRELECLCDEIRDFLIENVSKTGGHLSSNLGVIELTVAMHRCLHSPQDRILFDVGHQCYTHKLLTGRRAGFDGLRMMEGIAGFPSPAESEHDAYVAGHGSASISAAIGIARAKKLKNEPGLVVVVVGDGAFTGGMAYEGINNVDSLDNLVIVLNDNTMSISKNVGALARYFKALRTSPEYYKTKNDVKSILSNTPVIGNGMMRGIKSIKDTLRKGLYHTTFFEEMGLRYMGPVDGHDLPTLCRLFNNIHTAQKPLMLHVETKKGKGFSPAERNPGAFHGVSAFDTRHIEDPDLTPGESFSTVFGRTLSSEADRNPSICAITAAMKYGTGLQYFKKAHLERFFDVGMAEEHAITFAGGLAAEGMLPVVAIYSTFLQRGYDQFIHDIMLMRNNVMLAVDRAGLVPGDGETHQGIYDAAFLSQQPDMVIVSPANYEEAAYWTKKLLHDYQTPRVLRYPRGGEPPLVKALGCTGNPWDRLTASEKPKAAIVTYGVEAEQALEAAGMLAEHGCATDVFKMAVINPIPEDLVRALAAYPLVLFAEEGVRQGGIGEHMAARLLQAGYAGRYIHKAVEQNRLPHATVPELRRWVGLDADALCGAVLDGKATHEA